MRDQEKPADGRRSELIWRINDPEPHVFADLFTQIGGLTCGDLPGSAIYEIEYKNGTLKVTVQ